MRQDDLDRCGALLAEGLAFWEAQGRPPAAGTEIPALVLDRLGGEKGVQLAAACRSFLLYRLLHHGRTAGDAASVLLGDYFFGLFSRCLIPLDSTWLIEAFARFLREDAEEGVRGRAFDLERYRDFVEAAACRIAVC